MLRIFVGYDGKETVAYHVLAQSIIDHASIPVAITPLALRSLDPIMQRPRDPKQSTEFSFSRFLTPYLAGYTGWALFMDCDMLCRADVAEIYALRDPDFAVQVVKHDYQPAEDVKFLGNVQTRYEKKNWSSVMLFNCNRCHALTSDYVRTASGLDLHQFKWLDDDGLIGELPQAWNHLVGVYPHDRGAALVHFTEGGPWFPDYRMADYAQEWFQARHRATSAAVD